MTEKKSFGWGDLIYVVILTMMFIMMLVGMVSCGSSKKTQSTHIAKTDSVVIHDTVTKIKSDTIHVTKTETKIETKTDVLFDTIQKDCPKNKITYKANGDVELEGAIKEYKQDISIIQSKYDSARYQLEEEKASRFFWQNKSEELEKRFSKKKGVPIIIWVSWTLSFIIALIGGIYIGVRFRNFFINL